jgi:hypothetical protein
MKNYVYTRSTTDKFAIKGIVVGDRIEYVNSDKEPAVIDIADIFERFDGKDIALAISVKTDEDLEEE